MQQDPLQTPQNDPASSPASPPVASDSPVMETASSITDPRANVIAWEASEHLQHNNGAGWYLAFFFVVAILILFAAVFRAWTFIPVILVMAVAGILYVRRPPRTLHYVLTPTGLEIEGVPHPYSTFKSFSVIRDGAFFAILLIPIKRFSPATTVYFDAADGEAIVDVFGAYLPMENRDLDPLERFLRLIRF